MQLEMSNLKNQFGRLLIAAVLLTPYSTGLRAQSEIVETAERCESFEWLESTPLRTACHRKESRHLRDTARRIRQVAHVDHVDVEHQGRADSQPSSFLDGPLLSRATRLLI
ncbi:hypothetical protein B7486_07820 [cyanobacterium TDX16]|nr:hypothetical protein B7486_07820 [cyanobacterium TDX16]